MDLETYGPDHVHLITFGAIHRSSMVAKMVQQGERSDLATGSGRFSALRSTREMTNDEVYRYLRIGVSTQSAVALKLLGYDSPESLIESPVTGPRLPDHLAFDGVLANRFIDECESTGVSAMECQYALRRGVVDEHLGGLLDVRQLVHVFRNYVSGKKRVATPTANRNLCAADFVVDGTIPFETLQETTASVAILNSVGQVFAENKNRPVVEAIKRDAELFEKFIKPLGLSYSHESVLGLIKSIENYGTGVLDLRNPLCCALPISDEEGAPAVGIEPVRYMEEMQSHSGRRAQAHGFVGHTGLHVSDRVITFIEFEEMRAAGLSVETAGELVFERRMTPGAAVLIHQEGIPSSLMIGAL